MEPHSNYFGKRQRITISYDAIPPTLKKDDRALASKVVFFVFFLFFLFDDRPLGDDLVSIQKLRAAAFVKVFGLIILSGGHCALAKLFIQNSA